MRLTLLLPLCYGCDLTLLDRPTEALTNFDSLSDRTGYLQSCSQQLSSIFRRVLQNPLGQATDEYLVSISRFQTLAGILRDSRQGFNAKHWGIILSSLEIIRPYVNLPHFDTQ